MELDLVTTRFMPTIQGKLQLGGDGRQALKGGVEWEEVRMDDNEYTI
jgi:hypothetical protein